MNVEELLAQPEAFLEQEVALAGYLLVVVRPARHFEVHLSAGERLTRRNNLLVQQPFAEVKRIIQPMSQHLLSARRGQLLNPPYLYHFPLHLRALVGEQDNLPVLRRIHSVDVPIPYQDSLAALTETRHWHYRATVHEAPQEAAPARIAYEKDLRLREMPDEPRPLHEGQHLHARSVLGQTVSIPGRLNLHIVSHRERHFTLESRALRAERFAVQPAPVVLWLPPMPHDRILIICGDPYLKREQRFDHDVEISGKIRYLHPSERPDLPVVPRLAFTQVNAVRLRGELLLHRLQ